MGFFQKIKDLISLLFRKVNHFGSQKTRTSVRERRVLSRKADYFIEIRLIDRKTKAEMKRLEDSLSKKFHIGKTHYVPHISLVGGFKTSHEKRFVDDFHKICSQTPLMKFTIKGWDIFSGKNNVAFFKIDPSPELRKFRWLLANTFLPYGSGFTPFDHQSEEDFIFHGTIALHIPPGKFDKALSFIRSQFPTHINGDYYVDRVTILKNHRILWEYDFFLRERINRSQAHTPKVYRFTERVKSDVIHDSEDIITLNSLERRVFLISDSHFDHENIIRYTNRTFSSLSSMNDEMLGQWNSTVGKNDIVLFIGDLTYGRDCKGISYWLSQLQGDVRFIKGSHDKIEDLSEFHKITKLRFENHPDTLFILSHDPKDIGPQYQNYWKIHGHLHNNNIEKYPFINGDNKTINVSVELLDYTPLDIEMLFHLNFTKIRYMKDIHSEPEYFS
jgi:calcineurin-like phosphoesterase family protein